MDIINKYVVYVNYLLAFIAIIFLFVLLFKTNKIKRSSNIIKNDTTTLSFNIQNMNDTITSIKETENSWRFFISLYVILVVIKETIKYRKSDNTISKSFVKSCIRHSKQLSSIKF